MRIRSLAAAGAAMALLIAVPACKDDEPAPETHSETDVDIKVTDDGGSVGVEHQDESGNDVSVEVGTDSDDNSGGS